MEVMHKHSSATGSQLPLFLEARNEVGRSPNLGSVQDTCKNRSQGFEKDWSWLERLWHRIHVKVVFTETAEVFSCVGAETRDKAMNLSE
jgi:hypothetical protein